MPDTINVELTPRQMKVIMDLLVFHMPIGGGSVEHHTAGVLSKLLHDNGYETATDFASINEKMIEQHLENNEGEYDPLAATLRQVISEYCRVWANIKSV